MVFAAMSHNGWVETGTIDGVGEWYLPVVSQLIWRQGVEDGCCGEMVTSRNES